MPFGHAGEHRFTAAVARRLESLGALTKGDRHAASALDLKEFNLDNKYGARAARLVLEQLATAGYADAPTEIVESLTTLQLLGPDSKKGPCVLVRVRACECECVPVQYTDIEVKQFLGRMLGLPLMEQNWLFEKFSGTLEALIAEAKQAGKYIQGR